MPKRRRISFKYGTRKKRRTYVPRPVKSYVARRMWRSKETKQYTIGGINTTVGSYGSGGSLNYNLCQIAQGDGASNRDGNLIWITGFYARFTVTYQDTTNIIRFMLWQDKGDNDVTSSTMEVQDAHDQDTTRLYKDVIVGVGSGGPMQRTVTIRKKFRKPFRYYGSGSTDLVTPPIVFTVMSDSSAAAHPALVGHFRLYWKDP